MGELFENILILVFVLQAVWSLFGRLLGKRDPDEDVPAGAHEGDVQPQEELGEWLRHAGTQLDNGLQLAADLDARLDDLNRTLEGGGGSALQSLREVLENPVRRELSGATELMERARAAQEQGAEAFFRRADGLRKAYDALGLGRIRVEALETMVRWRSDKHLGGHLADADAMAEGLLRPLRTFALAHGLAFPPVRPVCAPALPGQEAVVYGLFPGRPVIFVPDDFGEDLMRWPSLAHEIGHVMWRFLPGFARDVRAFIVSDQPPWLPHADGRQVVFDVHACFGAWLPEIVADLFCAMLLGPAALRGMVASFAGDHPTDVIRAHAALDGQTVEEHPPAHLRVLLVAHLLERSGFPPSEWEDLVRDWEVRHQEPTTLVFPTLYGDEVELGLPRFLALGRALVDRFSASEYSSLSGYTFSAVHDLTMPPGLWAQVKQRSVDLRADEPFNDNPRIVLAAAIEAAGRGGGAVNRIAAGVRRAVIGLGTGERRVADPAYAIGASSKELGSVTAEDVVDAMRLRALLHRPHAHKDRWRRPEHTL